MRVNYKEFSTMDIYTQSVLRHLSEDCMDHYENVFVSGTCPEWTDPPLNNRNVTFDRGDGLFSGEQDLDMGV